ncbi:MAG: peroxiredoxin family protein [Acidimicrobiales bacterium]
MTTGTGQQQPDLRALVAQMIDRLRSEGVTPGIEVGDRAPSFVLADAYGGRVALDDRLAAGPVVLSFYRGAWCPICNTELTGLQDALGRIKELGASLLAVSPQAPDASQTLVERLGLGYDVLSDLDQAVIRAYRLQFELPPELRGRVPPDGHGARRAQRRRIVEPAGARHVRARPRRHRPRPARRPELSGPDGRRSDPLGARRLPLNCVGPVSP